MSYTIKQLSEIINISPHTIRYYDKEGLLPVLDRDKNGFRIFKESDVEWFIYIECLKKSGMSINEIRHLVTLYEKGDSTIDERLQIFVQKRIELEEKLQELQDTLDLIKYKEWYYNISKAAGTTSVHKTMKEEDIPAQMLKIRNNQKCRGLKSSK